MSHGSSFSYIRDPAEISRKSFEILEQEAGLERFPSEIRAIVARMIHATGLPELADCVEWRGNVAVEARDALSENAAVLCDAEMIRSGLTCINPAQLQCTLNATGVADHAKAQGMTRSAAGVELFWPPMLSGAVVVIGNAPTALFRLLEGLAEGWPCPSVIFGLPVGFIGAAESKRALMDAELDCPCLTVHGRMGGSAMASGALNALMIKAV